MSLAEELTGMKCEGVPSAPDKDERLRTLTVEVLLDVRSAYLSSPSANALKMREMIPNRARAALRTGSSVAAWHTRLVKHLGVVDIDRYRKGAAASKALIDLIAYVEEGRLFTRWRALFIEEFGYWFALVWRLAEERKDAREAARLTGKDA